MKPYPTSAIAYFILYIGKYKKLLIPLAISIFFGCFFEKLSPYYFSKIIDTFSLNVPKDEVVHQISYFFTAFVVSLLLYNVIRQAGMYLAAYIFSNLSIVTKEDGLMYIVNHSMQYLSNQQSGKLGAKVTDLSNETANMFFTVLWGFYYPLVTLLITFGMLFSVNWMFAAMFLFWMVVFGLIMVRSSGRLKKYSEDRSEKSSITSGRIIDILTNTSLIKSFASLAHEHKEIAPLLEAERQARKTMFFKIETSRFVQFIVVGLFQISMLILAICLWYQGLITTGSVVFMLLLISSVMSIFQHFVFSLLDWNRNTGTIDNCLEYLSHPHDIVDKPNARALKVKKGIIEFKNMFFKYQERKKVFEDFNLSIKAGERIGLVGVSGSGKSTLVNLLQRFYEPQKGQILIDGQNILEVTQDSLHRAIAVIPQDTSLFHRSIYDNIAYGNPKASKKAILDAAKKAYADDFIQEMPQGYDSLVGERGIKVSGGQRQRIAVARAILKNAPILILDEATSALDSESEQFIQKSMKKLMQGKTVIAIAHRLSTLKEMDRIIVMSKGRIVEQGTADELLKKKGTYAHLWQIQTEAQK